MKKLFTLAFAVLLLVSLTLAGCGNGGASSAQSAKEALSEAFAKSSEVKSSKFDGSMKLNLQLPESAMADPDAAMVLGMLNNAELTFHGTSQLDPMMAELFLTLRISGDAEMAFNLSMLVTEEKMWVKVPNIPFLPLPESIVGKYLVLDFAELSEMAGEEIVAIDPELQARYQQLGTDIMDIFFGAYDEETYFTIVNKDESTVPSDVDAAQVIEFNLTNENLRPFIETFIEILPDVLDKVAEIEDAGVTQADIDEFKAEIEANKDDIEQGLAEIEDMVNINNFSATTALDKDKFITYSDFDVSVDITAEGETGTFGFNVAMKQSEINKNPAFEMAEPDAADTVTIDQLMMEMMGGY